MTTSRETLIKWFENEGVNMAGRTITCDECGIVGICDFAYDPYNIDGDCLADK